MLIMELINNIAKGHGGAGAGKAEKATAGRGNGAKCKMQKQLKNCKNNNLGAVKKLQQKRATIFFSHFFIFLIDIRKNCL